MRKCNVCGLRENLWTCLQCGYTGCGRYTSQHAKKHFHQKGIKKIDKSVSQFNSN